MSNPHALDVKADIAEIKTLILNINKTLMEMK